MALRKAELTRKKAGVFSDGNGLFLNVRKTAAGDFSRDWFFRVEVDGKKRKLSLGHVRSLPVEDARVKAIELKKRLRDEPDILRHVRAGKSLKAALNGGITPNAGSSFSRDGSIPTFRAFAWQWMDENLPATLSNKKHIAQWYSSLETYAMAILALPLDQITTEHVISCLKPIWHEKTETARRVGQRISKILKVAVALQIIPFDPADRKLITAILPTRRLNEDEIAERHHAALDIEDAPAMYAWLMDRNSAASVCLALIMMSAARSHELRGAKWKEFDFKKGLWTVPAARMKRRRTHNVPLTNAMKDTIIHGLRITTSPTDGRTKMEREEFAFPSGSQDGYVTEAALRKIIAKSPWKGVTIHGMRSTFRNWAARNKEDWAAVELQLAHQVGTKTQAAYFRDDLLEQRSEVLERWHAYLCSQSG